LFIDYYVNYNSPLQETYWTCNIIQIYWW
jgi:hypothetical protein